MPTTFLTANDLRTGEIVFWSAKGVWSLNSDQALLAEDEAGVDALNQVINQDQTDLEVVGPYLVTNQDQTPKKLRERRRLAGPGATLLPTKKAA